MIKYVLSYALNSEYLYLTSNFGVSRLIEDAALYNNLKDAETVKNGIICPSSWLIKEVEVEIKVKK